MPNDIKKVINAAIKNDFPLIREFIESGEDANLKDLKTGKTLLQLVMEQPEFDEELALYLIQSGAGLSHFVNVGLEWCEESFYPPSFLHLAYLHLPQPSKSKLFDFLLDCLSEQILTQFDEAGVPEHTHFSIYLAPGDNLMRRYQDCYSLERATLFHLAIAKGDFSTVEKILSTKKIDINTPCWLVQNKHLLGSYDNLNNEVLNIFVGNLVEDEGVLANTFTCRTSVEVVRTKDVTPLHLAARSGNQAMAQLLFRFGANPLMEDSNKETPLEYLKLTRKDKIFSSAHKDFVKEVNLDEIDSLIKEFHRLLSEEPKYRHRLILGEGDFSYTTSLVNKHRVKRPHLAEAITATEYLSFDELRRVYGEDLLSRLTMLREQGVTIACGVDARRLTDYKFFSMPQAARISRIHFNFPHDRSNFRNRTLPTLLRDFFNSAAQIQIEDDQVLMALPKIANADRRRFYHSYVYGIFEASARAGYILVKKRHFGAERYVGYKHVITGCADSANVAHEGDEFIFAKTNMTYQEIRAHKKYGPGGVKYAYDEHNCYLRELPTDSDSSDYEDSDRELGVARL